MKRLLTVVAFAALMFTVTAARAADPGVTCAATKRKAAVKKLGDKVKCYGNALKKGIAVDPTCLTNAEAKFQASFGKAEGKGGCATTGDAAVIEVLMDDTLTQLLEATPATTTTTTTSASTSTTTTTVVPGVCDQQPDCAACTTCTIADGGACQAAFQACDLDIDCAAYLACLNACSDQACALQCPTDYPDGANSSLLPAVLDCFFAQCPVTCAVP